MQKLQSHGALKFGEFVQFPAEFDAVKRIKGSSLTIPGQARDLASILASAKFSGGMVPRHGTPLYDDDEAHALARVQFEGMDDEQVSQIAQECAAAAVQEERSDEQTEAPAPDELASD